MTNAITHENAPSFIDRKVIVRDGFEAREAIIIGTRTTRWGTELEAEFVETRKTTFISSFVGFEGECHQKIGFHLVKETEAV